jgi:hypothetical protein
MRLRKDLSKLGKRIVQVDNSLGNFTAVVAAARDEMFVMLERKAMSFN